MSSMLQHSPRQHTKLVLYLLLWQLLGSEFKFQSTAASAPAPAPAPADEPLLLKAEVTTLTAIKDKLEVKNLTDINESFCQDIVNSYRSEIVCNCSFNENRTCHITMLFLYNADLSTFIPYEVGELLYLDTLILSSNKLQGTIPDSLGKLKNLRTLDLSSNQLTGKIPEALGNLYSLNYLHLQFNRLEGRIPQSLGSLYNLLQLSLGYNNLTGLIPDELGQLANLTDLLLSENQLTGPLPTTLGHLRNLQDFLVTGNSLTEDFPGSYRNLKNLRSFSLSGNSVSGSFPNDVIKYWENIQRLFLDGNNFKGKLSPKIFNNLENLKYLWVSDLENDGFEFPDIKTKFTSLTLRNCGIRGPISPYIQNMSSLKYLDLSFNKLTGGIPHYFKSNNLYYMSLAGNMLTGPIPESIFKDDRTKGDLSFNNLSAINSGALPKDLNLFACCRNSSPNDVPEDYMKDPYQLMKTYCPRNQQKYHSLFINCGGGDTIVNGKHYDHDNETMTFYTSPEKNWAYSSSGYVGESTNASEYIKNVTCGVSVAEAPLYDKARLSPLSLKYYAFCLREGNYTVTLHFAEIVHTEATEDAEIVYWKREFNVYIQGERQLTDFNIKERAGGPNIPIMINFTAVVKDSLLTIHLYWAGKGTSEYITTFNGPLISAISVIPDFKVDDEMLTPSHIALITIASISTALLLLVALAWRIGWLETTKSRNINVGQNKSVTVKQLIAATGNFNDKRKIGGGAFGAVYEAKLQGDTTVAVKRLSANFKEKIQEFKNEITNITTLEHANLIKLLAVHIEKDLKIFVYEYMKNKSLKEALFDPTSTVKLSWNNRFNIIMGVAKGLEYLHNHPTVKLVHMNIKPSNILLDENLDAKISDFGLARLYSEEDQLMVIPNEMKQGYVARECYQGIITNKADVFSFGMVVLEIVSGKKNVASKPNKESVLLLDMAHKYVESKNLLSLVDENLGDDCNTKQAHTILTLAVKCTSSGYSNRPTMSDIVKELMRSMEDSNTSVPPATNESENTNTNSGDQAKAPSVASTEVSAFSPATSGGDELVEV